MYKAVIFDAGGVLHASTTAVTDDLKQELSLTDEQINEIWQADIPQLGLGQVTERGFWKRVSQRLGIRLVNPNENLLGRAFAKNLKPYLAVYELIGELKSHGIPIVVLSNTIEPHTKALRVKNAYAPFDHVLLSHEIGLRKPDPDSFHLALERLNLPPEEVILVDDELTNVRAAEQLGIKCIVFTSPERVVLELQALLLPAGPGNADILLVRRDGALILQQRDDKPEINNPGLITGFGGHIEPGETALEAAIRELKEETNLDRPPADFQFIGLYHKTKAVHGEDWDVWFFVVRDVDDTKLEVYEGQGFVIAQNRKQARALKTSILLRQQVLDDYYKILNPKP